MTSPMPPPRRHLSVPPPASAATRAGALALALTAAALVGCGEAPGGGGAEAGGKRTLEEGFAVGLLLPESKTARYEAFDRPLIEQTVKSGCPRCTVLYLNAQQDAAKQQAQADSLLSQGVQVLILDAVDARAAGAIVTRAEEQGVPVVAYDRFASGEESRAYFASHYGPTIAVYNRNADDPAAVAALDEALADLGDAALRDGVMEWEYLLFTATVR